MSDYRKIAEREAQNLRKIGNLSDRAFHHAKPALEAGIIHGLMISRYKHEQKPSWAVVLAGLFAGIIVGILCH